MRPAGRNRRRARASVSSTPWTMSSGSAPLARASTIQLVSPIDPSGPGSKTYSADTRPASTAVPQRRDVRLACASSPVAPGARPNIRAPLTFGASTAGTLNFGPRRLRLLAIPPADGDRRRAARADQLLGQPPEQEQLFVRRVRRQRGSGRRRGSRGRPRRAAPAASPSASCHVTGCCMPLSVAHRAAAAADRRLRSSGSRSGRCRTSSSR